MTFYRRFIFIFIVLSMTLHSPTLLGGRSAKEVKKNKEIKEIKRHLERERQNLELLRSKKVSILDVLEKLDRKIHKARKEGSKLKSAINDLVKEIQGTEKEIRKKKLEINKKRKQVDKRLISLYKMGELGSVKILFSSNSFSDLMIRSHQLNWVIRSDLQLIKQFNVQLSQLQGLKEELRQEKQKLEIANEKAKDMQRELVSEQTQKKAVIKAISGEEKIHKRYIEELKQAKKDLEKLMDSLWARKSRSRKGFAKVSDRGFAARKGTLKPPIEGKIQKKFGKYKDPKFFTYQFHKGLDISAKSGGPIQSVYEGTVVYSGWFKGFGQIIIIDHGGGYHTLSANTQDLFKGVGDEVGEGERVGKLASKSELPIYQKPHLYFEVREHGKSVDPLLWLAKSDFL